MLNSTIFFPKEYGKKIILQPLTLHIEISEQFTKPFLVYPVDILYFTLMGHFPFY